MKASCRVDGAGGRAIDEKRGAAAPGFCGRRSERVNDRPPQFPPALPIAARVDEIIALLRRCQVVVVAGETGSGKTTQLPKACLAAGLGERGAIAVTQPRRLAARAAAARIAEELGVPLGAEVGYAVRFDARVSRRTRVKVMTDGLLLVELQRDPLLRRYECVIVDEAHERSLNVDFLLGGLRRLLDQRADLKVVITSATIDVDMFAARFDGAPVVAVAGRTYPVEVVYLPVDPVGKNTAEADSERALLNCLRRIADEAPAGRRDILVFQTGEREIFDNARLLKRHFGARFDVLPLYARLPATEQARVFAPGDRQRVVLATNVAETSLTVPNIGYVVDPGFARVNRYSYRSKLQRLRVEPISQASAAQRAGRCGRVAPGVCYRLYDEDALRARPKYTEPELKRANLAAVVLAMRAFGLGEIERFPFIEPPAPAAVRDAMRLLRELRALDDTGLTDIGRMMAQLPVDPRLARMLVAAAGAGALAEMLIIVSALAVRDPRLRPLDRQAAADKAHAAFADDAGSDRRSDFGAFARLWRWLETVRAEHGRNSFRRLLEDRFLSPGRVREWRALHRQLLLSCRALGLRMNERPADYAAVHGALLAGSLGFVGLRRDPDADPRPRKRGAGKPGPEYDGPRGLRFRLFPGSALRDAAPKWVVAAEVSDTGRPYARCVAAVAPEWIEEAAAHIAKKHYSAPRWDSRRGEAIVLETVSVYGLTVVGGRPRRAALVDMRSAREIFALAALVRGDRRVSAPFLKHNQLLIEKIKEQEAKRRRMDLLASEAARAAFYLARLPPEVCSVASWRKFVARASPSELTGLKMRRADLLSNTVGAASDADFPPELAVDGGVARLAYKFAPGELDDGVSARVNLATLARLDADALEWLVPGFLEEKCVALVKALPKTWRRQLAPVPDRVRDVLPSLLAPTTHRQSKLTEALAAALCERFGVRVPAAAWRVDKVPPHLRMNVAVLGRGGRVVDQARDLATLRERQSALVERAVLAPSRHDLERRGLREFPPDAVPSRIEVPGPDGPVAIYPVLVDRGDCVDLLMRADASGHAALNRGGYTRLALLAQAGVARRLRRDVERDSQLAACFDPFGSVAELADAVLAAAVWRACFDGRELPTTRQAFNDRMATAALGSVFESVFSVVRAVLGRRRGVARRVATMNSPALALSRDDLTAQLADLTGPGFLTEASRRWLAELPRYLDAMDYRIDRLRLGGRVKRDRESILAVAPWERRLESLRAAGVANDELRLLVQEFRVATFSQAVGVRGKVSAQRLEARFSAYEMAAGTGPMS